MDTRSRLGRVAGCLALSTALFACAQDSLAPTSTGDLTSDEAVALADFLRLDALTLGRTEGTPVRAATVRGDGEVVSVGYDFTRPCLRGGSVRSSGTIRTEREQGPPLTSAVDVTNTDVHQACVFMAADTRISLSGDPSVTSTVHAASRDNLAWGPQTVSVVGGVSWVADDGRSGRCDLDVWVSADNDAGVHTTRGTVCGHTFDVTVTESS